jgi:hypothetical protein
VITLSASGITNNDQVTVTVIAATNPPTVSSTYVLTVTTSADAAPATSAPYTIN